jgi:hypothetical protein
MSSPQVNTNPKSDQTNTNSTQTTQQITWETILKSPRIERQYVDFALSHINDAPKMPVEFVYNQLITEIKIFPPTSVAVSGVGGVIGAVLALKYAREGVKYFITTQEVLDADEKSPLHLSKYTLERLSEIYHGAEVIVVKLNEFEKIKLLLQYGGIYISGLPYELTIQISQLAGFGRLWHFSPVQRKFYVF